MEPTVNTNLNIYTHGVLPIGSFLNCFEATVPKLVEMN